MSSLKLVLLVPQVSLPTWELKHASNVMWQTVSNVMMQTNVPVVLQDSQQQVEEYASTAQFQIVNSVPMQIIPVQHVLNSTPSTVDHVFSALLLNALHVHK